MKTIFLDFGNVIGFFDHSRAIKQLAPFTDHPVEELDSLLYGGALGDAYDSGRISTSEYLAEIRTRAGLRCSDEQFLAAYTDIFWPNPDVCEVVPKLAQRYRLVLASNTNDAHYQRFTRMFSDVLSHLDHLVASHIVGARKPKPEFYARAQAYAEAHPHECVFVDDLEKNIRAAQDHGWHAVHYRSGDRIAEKLREAGVAID